MENSARTISLLVSFAIMSSAHTQALAAPEPVEPEVHVRFEADRGAFAELELVRSVDEETGEEKMAFTGQLVSSEGRVLIESFTIGGGMAHIASVADAYTVMRKGESAVAWTGGGPDTFEFLTLDGEKRPSAVDAGSDEDQLEVRVDVFGGQRALQHAYEDAGGEGSIAVAITLAFRDLHTNASRSTQRGDGDCDPSFETCRDFAECACGAGIHGQCCSDGQANVFCCLSSFSHDPTTCACSFSCKDNCDPPEEINP